METDPGADEKEGDGDREGESDREVGSLVTLRRFELAEEDFFDLGLDLGTELEDLTFLVFLAGG